MTSGPIIWSETRQELCESLPYYRAYQTGCYVASTTGKPPSSTLAKIEPTSAILKDSIPYGYLLAGFPSRRDACAANGRVIISHGGGKSEIDDPQKSSGSSSSHRASLKQDQSSSDSIIRALLHSSRHRLPIVLIAGEGYALLPFKLKCSYAVLGWYVITDCWAEREVASGQDDNGFVRWKFRFEWIPVQGEPWWELAREAGRESWDPRLRIETFTKAQRRSVKQMRGKSKGKKAPDLSTMASSSTALPMSSTSSPKTKQLDDDERDRLLFGPLTSSPELISTVNATPRSTTPCNLSSSATCLTCKSPSPTVYTCSWMCLNPACTWFFLLPSGLSPNEDTLAFTSSILSPIGTPLNSSFPSGQPPFPLIPRRPSCHSMDQARGLWCKHCGRLSCREVIFQPRCAHCGGKIGKWKPLPLVPSPTLARGALDFSRDTAAGRFDPIINREVGIAMSVRREHGLVMYTFAFPETFGDCRVHLVQADVERGEHEEDADRLFEGFQRLTWPLGPTSQPDDAIEAANHKLTPRKRRKPNPPCPSSSSASPHPPSSSISHPSPALTAPAMIPFRRHPLKTHAGGPGRMLTQQFTCNYGVAYKHVVAMGTLPLSASSTPAPILSTLALLHRRTRCVLPSFSESFNELYPVLYLQHQKMGFHDDGEPGLGPVVSSLSLGSTCRMRFRIKAKHASELAGVVGTNRVVLDLPLRHGSVVVQHGNDLQRLLEHCVNPDGFRIAVTARRIDDEAVSASSSRQTRQGDASADGADGADATTQHRACWMGGTRIKLKLR